MVGCDYMEVIFFSVSVNHVNGSHLDFTFLIPYGLYLLLCFLLKEFINSLYYKSIKSEVSISIASSVFTKGEISRCIS